MKSLTLAALAALTFHTTLPAVAADSETVFQSYCNWTKASTEVSRQADLKFGTDVDDKTFLKKDAWVDARNTKLENKMRAETGLDYDQMMDLASNGDWEQKCTSQDNGLVNVGVQEALAATDDDVSPAKEALELYYYTQLHSADKDVFFDPSRYSAARCTPMVKEGFRLIACQLVAIGVRSGFDMYVIAHLDGKPVITTLSPESRDERIGSLRSLQDANMNEIAIGHFTKYPVPDAFLRAKQQFKESLYQ